MIKLARHLSKKPGAVHSIFIATILTTSLISRVTRATELRVTEVKMGETARRFIQEAASGEIRIIANEPNQRDQREYVEKEREERAHHHIPASRAPAESGFVPVCPLTTAWPSATRPRWPSRMPDPATGMFGHSVQTATLPGPWLKK